MPIVRIVPPFRTFGVPSSFNTAFYRSINRVYRRYKRPLRKFARRFSPKFRFTRRAYKAFSRGRRFYKRYR